MKITPSGDEEPGGGEGGRGGLPNRVASVIVLHTERAQHSTPEDAESAEAGDCYNQQLEL